MAKDFAIKYLGVNDSISTNLSNIYEKARAEIENKILKVKNQEEKMERNRAKQRGLSAGNKQAMM